MENFQDRGVWTRIRSLKIMDPDSVCPDWLDPDPDCPGWIRIQLIADGIRNPANYQYLALDG